MLGEYDIFKQFAHMVEDSLPGESLVMLIVMVFGLYLALTKK